MPCVEAESILCWGISGSPKRTVDGVSVSLAVSCMPRDGVLFLGMAERSAVMVDIGAVTVGTGAEAKANAVFCIVHGCSCAEMIGGCVSICWTVITSVVISLGVAASVVYNPTES